MYKNGKDRELTGPLCANRTEIAWLDRKTGTLSHTRGDGEVRPLNVIAESASVFQMKEREGFPSVGLVRGGSPWTNIHVLTSTHQMIQ